MLRSKDSDLFFFFFFVMGFGRYRLGDDLVKRSLGRFSIWVMLRIRFFHLGRFYFGRFRCRNREFVLLSLGFSFSILCLASSTWIGFFIIYIWFLRVWIVICRWRKASFLVVQFLSFHESFGYRISFVCELFSSCVRLRPLWFHWLCIFLLYFFACLRVGCSQSSIFILGSWFFFSSILLGWFRLLLTNSILSSSWLEKFDSFLPSVR